MAGRRNVTPDTPPWLAQPGEQDITATWTSRASRAAAEAEGLTTLGFLDQTYFLRSRLPNLASLEPANLRDPANLKNRLALKTLLMPGGLGSTYKVMIFGKASARLRSWSCSYKMRSHMNLTAWFGLAIMIASEAATLARIEPFWSWNTPIALDRVHLCSRTASSGRHGAARGSDRTDASSFCAGARIDSAVARSSKATTSSSATGTTQGCLETLRAADVRLRRGRSRPSGRRCSKARELVAVLRAGEGAPAASCRAEDQRIRGGGIKRKLALWTSQRHWKKSGGRAEELCWQRRR